KDGARDDVIAVTVGVRVMDEKVHVAPQQILCAVAQQIGAGSIDEDTAAREIDAIDALAGGLEQQLELIAPGAMLVRGEGAGTLDSGSHGRSGSQDSCQSAGGSGGVSLGKIKRLRGPLAQTGFAARQYGAS